MQLVLVMAMAMTAAPMARAQQATVQPAVADSGDAMQATNVAQSIGIAFKDDLFAGTEKFAKGATDVSEINLDPKTMGMVPGGYAGGMAHRMKFMVIRNYTYDKPGMYNMDDVEVYRKRLNDGTWSCSIHVRNKDGATDICSRSGTGNEGSEMVIISAEPKELSFIHMSGNVSLADMARTGGSAAYLNQDLYSGSGATAKTAAAKAKIDAEVKAKIDAEVESRDAEAKARDAEAKARDAEAKARDAQAKANVAMKKKRTFRIGSMSYSSESSTPAKGSSASASSAGTPTSGSSKPATPDSSASGSNTAAPPATTPASSTPAK
jgi:hypothetical protein